MCMFTIVDTKWGFGETLPLKKHGPKADLHCTALLTVDNIWKTVWLKRLHVLNKTVRFLENILYFTDLLDFCDFCVRHSI